jgi:hypothetical protein
MILGTPVLFICTVIGARVEELVHEVAVRTVNFELTHQQRREEEEKGSAAHIQPHRIPPV